MWRGPRGRTASCGRRTIVQPRDSQRLLQNLVPKGTTSTRREATPLRALQAPTVDAGTSASGFVACEFAVRISCRRAMPQPSPRSQPWRHLADAARPSSRAASPVASGLPPWHVLDDLRCARHRPVSYYGHGIERQKCRLHVVDLCRYCQRLRRHPLLCHHLVALPSGNCPLWFPLVAQQNCVTRSTCSGWTLLTYVWDRPLTHSTRIPSHLPTDRNHGVAGCDLPPIVLERPRILLCQDSRYVTWTSVR